MFSHYLVIAAGVLTVNTTPAPAVAPAAAGPVDPMTMNGKQIREYNASRQRSDPDYIRCVSQEQIGSLVQTNYVCHTNRQWGEIEDAANKNARDTLDAMNRQSTNGR